MITDTQLVELIRTEKDRTKFRMLNRIIRGDVTSRNFLIKSLFESDGFNVKNIDTTWSVSITQNGINSFYVMATETNMDGGEFLDEVAQFHYDDKKDTVKWEHENFMFSELYDIFKIKY